MIANIMPRMELHAPWAPELNDHGENTCVHTTHMGT